MSVRWIIAGVYLFHRLHENHPSLLMQVILPLLPLWGGISVSISSHDSAEAFPFCRGHKIHEFVPAGYSCPENAAEILARVLPRQLPRHYEFPRQNGNASAESCDEILTLIPPHIPLPDYLGWVILLEKCAHTCHAAACDSAPRPS